MFTIWTILRVIYSVIFTIVNIYISQFLKAVESKKNCPLSKGWRITNGKILSSLLMLVGLVNIFVPASKFLSTIPIIGSSYILLFVLALFMVLFIVNRLAVNIRDDEYTSCSIKGFDFIINFFEDMTITECIYYTIITTVIFFYL